MDRDFIGFRTRPKFIEAFKDEDGIPYYYMDRDLKFQYKDKDYEVKAYGEGGTFFTNLTSSPKMLWLFHRPNSKQTKLSSALHDFRYSCKYTSRWSDDRLFLISTKAEQLRIIKRIKNPRTKVFTIARYFFTRWALFFMLRVFGKPFKA